jgi:hypothetical protein
MRALFVCVLMLAAVLCFREGSTSPVFAQGKDKGKVTKGKEGAIEIAEGKDGKFRFFVRDDEGKLLAMSSPGGFASVKDAQKAIDELKDVIKTAKVTVAKKDGKEKDKK